MTHMSKESIQGISDTIKRNNVYTFANCPDTRTKQSDKIGAPKKDATLLTQLFLSRQSQPETGMSDFFRFQTQRESPSLADSDHDQGLNHTSISVYES